MIAAHALAVFVIIDVQVATIGAKSTAVGSAEPLDWMVLRALPAGRAESTFQSIGCGMRHLLQIYRGIDASSKFI